MVRSLADRTFQLRQEPPRFRNRLQGRHPVVAQSEVEEEQVERREVLLAMAAPPQQLAEVRAVVQKDDRRACIAW